MREYFRYFKWIYIILAVLGIIVALLNVGHWGIARVANYQRTNKECTTEQRVFDHGDVLTEKQEKKLEELIAKREKQTGCDIVLITLNESLKEYARGIEPGVRYSEFVRVYAEQFWEENGFGYDRPDGDGVVLVDNWFREDDGSIYTWLCTTGKAKEAYSAAQIDHILDNVYRYVEKDPYRAYKTYINDFYHDMLGVNVFSLYVPGYIPWLVGIVSAVIFTACNWQSKRGKKTTTAVTYVAGGKPVFQVRKDRFIRKTVTQRKIQRSSGGSGGSGGGGGGGHHGGGGHSR